MHRAGCHLWDPRECRADGVTAFFHTGICLGLGHSTEENTCPVGTMYEGGSGFDYQCQTQKKKKKKEREKVPNGGNVVHVELLNSPCLGKV